MLKLTNIVKDYPTNTRTVNALRNVNIEFRENEFVGILGPSGCGKTTLLNILGGLDRYTSGEMTIGNVSTKQFGEWHWDSYRNSSVGFVFQNYNLIPHLTVKDNVELSLTLAGESKKERQKKVLSALEKVGMLEEIDKRPNQLSGGQMQRVAIARALVNDPKIILADEPTGALDSGLSKQVCLLLQEISKEKLVIMVTHNDSLANEFCTRLVKFSDGRIINDSNPYDGGAEPVFKEDTNVKVKKRQKKRFWAAIDMKSVELIKKLGIKKKKKETNADGDFKRTSMNFRTALSLSGRNLHNKRGRTLLTSFAASIGIIGLSLVMAISNGFSIYMKKAEDTFLSVAPVGVYEYNVDYKVLTDIMLRYSMNTQKGTYPDNEKIGIVNTSDNAMAMGNMMEIVMKSVTKNYLTPEYENYIRKMDNKWYDAINFYYGTKLNLINYGIDDNGEYTYKETIRHPAAPGAMEIVTTVLGNHGMEPRNFQQLVGGQEFNEKYYDIIKGKYPQNKNELVLVVNENNEVGRDALKDFGIDIYQRDENGKILTNDKKEKYWRNDLTFDEIIGTTYMLVHNNDYYVQRDETLTSFEKNTASLETLYKNENNLELKIVGIMRTKPNSPTSLVGNNICFTPELGEYIKGNANQSEIAKAQQALIDSGSNKTVFNERLPEDNYLADNLIDFMITNKLNRSDFLKGLGVDVTPYYINVYASSNVNKDNVKNYIASWNTVNKEKTGEVNYFDFAEMVNHNMNTAMDMATVLLVAIASITLIVSSIMVAVITTNSVIERTREIGILRSLGARARDIITVFVAENFLIGLFSGLLGIGVAFALIPLGNMLIAERFMVKSLLNLGAVYAVSLVLISLFVNVISGLIPAIRASKKNVVECLRVE